MPVIGSLNGTSIGGWTEYAWQMEQAGADAIELNVYFLPTDIGMTSKQIEEAADIRAFLAHALGMDVGEFA